MCLYSFLFGRPYTPSPTNSLYSAYETDGYASDVDTMMSAYSSSSELFDEEEPQTLNPQVVRRPQRMRLWDTIIDRTDEEMTLEETESPSESGSPFDGQPSFMSVDESVSGDISENVHSNSSSDSEARIHGHNTRIISRTPFRNRPTYTHLGRPEVRPGFTGVHPGPTPIPAAAPAPSTSTPAAASASSPRKRKHNPSKSKVRRAAIKPYDSSSSESESESKSEAPSSDFTFDNPPQIRSFYSAYARPDNPRPLARRAPYIDMVAAHPSLSAPLQPAITEDAADRAYEADQSDNSTDRAEFSDWSDEEEDEEAYAADRGEKVKLPWQGLSRPSAAASAAVASRGV
ncbi:uncharacterized protein BP01DRAFT_136604 [Aspergillus saccharolyticus JOP 1030-1]|uniref:Uncharacterized protein n=1 Tax=Aspergillus saccharolyticus JOP 1030-1 TaxID=1450539 RepID=A0A318ZFD6_9EURO|nr:hypothetical protein BP01DRAFT_136604 [Aspergillus saccharolyticus JOP 1030-1]PYH42320.1 hypothetical protein BP01DRAFT_136604 [Aspergillus saccharolyticus JOP 1030-1]